MNKSENSKLDIIFFTSFLSLDKEHRIIFIEIVELNLSQILVSVSGKELSR